MDCEPVFFLNVPFSVCLFTNLVPNWLFISPMVQHKVYVSGKMVPLCFFFHKICATKSL